MQELEQQFDLHEQVNRPAPVVLEIGPRFSPASKEEGAQFFQDYPDAVYVAAELPSSVACTKKKDVDNIVSANVHALPFSDESIDIVLMRSIFGQFTGRGDSDIEDVRTFGMLEVSRALKPGGVALIFEENTPWYRDYIESYARDVGLEVIDTVYKFEAMEQEDPNPSWTTLRGMFYSAEDDRHTGKGWGDNDFPKCIILRKPLEVEYDELAFDVVVNSHALLEEYHRRLYGNQINTDQPAVEPKWRTLHFKRIATDEPED